MKYLFGLTGLFLSQFAYSAAVVSIAGKTYSVELQQFQPKDCPEDSPNVSATARPYISA
jgi:hypothetical protein